MLSPVGLISSLVQFYELLIIVYVLLSWFPSAGFLGDIRGALATLVEPYLGLFRKIIPAIGMVDISPIVAILVLQLFARYVIGLLL